MDGEFNLSNTIGIGLNIGEQMLLPVSNGEEEQQQHHQQYTDSLHVDYPTNLNNNPTNVSGIEHPMGNYYQENADLENLNARLAETTEMLEQEDKHENQIHQLEEPSQENKTETINEDEILDEDDEDVEEDQLEADEEEEDVPDEVEAVEEEIIPDEIKLPENQKDNDNATDKPKDEADEGGEGDKEKEDIELEDEQDDNDDDENKENNESEQPTSSTRASRRKEEEHVDENQCRVCCAKEDLVSLFKKIESQTVAEMLMTICPSIYITIKDFLPQYICNTCLDNVEKAIQLKKQCETTEKELRSKLSRHKNKIRRPVGYVVIDAPLDSDPPTDEELNDEEFKVSDVASVSPSEDSDDSEYSDSKKKKTRSRKRRKSAVVTPTESKRSKAKSVTDNQSSEEEDDEDDGDPIKSVKRKRSNNSSSPENYACDECNKSFSRKQSLILHKRQHVYEVGDPISCEVCGKKFKIKGAYRTHLEKHKEEKRTCKCGKCSRIFKNRADLNRHLAEDHKKKELLVSCSKCKRTFNSTSRLQRHKQGRCPAADSNKGKKPEINAFAVGTDLFKTVAPLQTTYWSDSFSD